MDWLTDGLNAARTLEDAFLGAAMQTSPCPDDFGGPCPDDFARDDGPKNAVQRRERWQDRQTWDDYMRIFRGDETMARYWYDRDGVVSEDIVSCM